ncbi:MAG: PilT/PilU family type 4a pilus ATPase [Bdellovibrionia bacterium]
MQTLGSFKSISVIDHILQRAVDIGATDIHLQAQEIPRLRVQGSMIQYGERPIDNGDLSQIVLQILTTEQRKLFHEGMNVDLAWERRGLGRFRFNFSRSRGKIVIAIRLIAMQVPTFEQLNLPQIHGTGANYRRGLVLVVGTTGSGKSTTLAAMIGHIAATQKCHIVSIEDPIEYVFPQSNGLITQKEVGRDVPSYPEAMRAVLRQDPDVIVIGEMRDRETIDTALLAAETGHFVISTLHTLDAAETIHRILSAYPAGQQSQVRQQMASILRAVVALRLVPKMDGSGVVPAVEVLINNDRIRDMIAKPDRIHEISVAIEESYEGFGMRTFDQSLMDLLSHGKISYDIAVTNASRPGLFDLRASGINSMGGDKKWSGFEGPKARAIKEVALEREEKQSSSALLDEQTTTAPSYWTEPNYSIESVPELRGRNRRPVRRHHTSQRTGSQDVQIWMITSLLGIITGLFLWWVTHDRYAHRQTWILDPGEYLKVEDIEQSKSKSKSRMPASMSRKKRVIIESD